MLISCLILIAGCNLFSSGSTPAAQSSTSTGIGLQTTPSQTSATSSTATVQSGSQTPQVNLPGFADLLDVIEHSVVQIDVVTSSTDVFGQVSPQQGAGSGWIIGSSGLIVTANHVIEGATSVTVTTIEGKTYPAQTVKGDASLDVGIIRINASQLPVLAVGDATNFRPGDWVLAIGNPLGQGIIATQGIISRLGVEIAVSSTQTFKNMIETTAAINPGNSGGPLINLDGKVIGITTIKVSASGIEGMGYAINIKDALPVIQSLSK